VAVAELISKSRSGGFVPLGGKIGPPTIRIWFLKRQMKTTRTPKEKSLKCNPQDNREFELEVKFEYIDIKEISAERRLAYEKGMLLLERSFAKADRKAMARLRRKK
jgi:hypothetical protein